MNWKTINYYYYCPDSFGAAALNKMINATTFIHIIVLFLENIIKRYQITTIIIKGRK